MDINLILELVKMRLGRRASELDGYFTTRIHAAIEELAKGGIHITDSTRDAVFVTDIVCWQYSNRDKSTAMPEWLKEAKRDRFLQEAKNDT